MKNSGNSSTNHTAWSSTWTSRKAPYTSFMAAQTGKCWGFVDTAGRTVEMAAILVWVVTPIRIKLPALAHRWDGKLL